MTRYLLDTNAVAALFNEPDGRMARRLRRHAPSDIALPAVVLHELYFGAFKSQRREGNLALVDGLQFEVIAIDRDDAKCAGEIRAVLSTQGRPIGPYDVLIAGQARARNLTLVTRNLREFERVPGLRAEDWEADPGVGP